MDGLYLDNIDEYINDHNKIVTYKWLSLALGVHVNVAKQMLFHYLDRSLTDGSKQLHATYLVSGKCFQNGRLCHKVSVVRQDKLEDVKSKMDSTLSVHVYSIQKAEIKDSSTLYSTDYNAVRENLKSCNRYSAIHCKAAVPRTSAEWEKTPSPEKVCNTPLTTHPPVSKSNTKAQKGIMGMFANKSSKIEVKQEKKEEAVVEPPDNKPPKKASVMKNFWGKQTTEKAGKSDVQEEADRSPQSPKRDRKDSDSELPFKSEESKDKEAGNSDPFWGSKDNRSKTKRPHTSESEDRKTTGTARPRMKRQRIQEPQPDSSEDEESPAKLPSATPNPPSQAKEEDTQTSEVSHESKKRKRRRVLKSKTFVDEEGCIVTEKAYESESYSEEENVEVKKPHTSILPAPAKKEEARKTVKKNMQASNKSSKQASIMGFFQKK